MYMSQSSSSRQRANQNTNIDGTLEIVFGLGHISIAAIILVSFTPLNGDILVTAFPLMLIVLFLAAMFFKHRVTLPRTGSATLRRPSNTSLGLFALSLFLFFVKPIVIAEVTDLGYPFIWGILLAVILLLMGRGVRRFYMYVVVALIVGAGATWARFTPDLGAAIVSLIVGLVLVISGAIVLRHYLTQ